MPSTYTPIATTTLGSDTASYTFTSIPSTYTDLIIVASAQRAISGSGGAGTIQVNGDGGSNYSSTLLYNDGATVYSYRWSNQTTMNAAFNAADSSYGVNTIHIMNYANTTTYKTILSRYGWPASNDRVATGVNLWRSTSAITSITLSAASNIKAGSTFTLYGIEAA
jgi:hypothetical protein